MKTVIFSNEMFTDLILKVFLPILAIVVVIKIIIDIYAIHARKKNIEGIDDKIKFHSTLISIVITIILLAIAVSFSVNFYNMIAQNKIDGNKYILYMIAVICPLIPTAFLAYLIPKIVKFIINEDKHKHTKKIEKNKTINNVNTIPTEKKIDEDIEYL